MDGWMDGEWTGKCVADYVKNKAMKGKGAVEMEKTIGGKRKEKKTSKSKIE